MEPKPDQDVAKPNAVSPRFSGSPAVPALTAPPRREHTSSEAVDQDLKAVAKVLEADRLAGAPIVRDAR